MEPPSRTPLAEVIGTILGSAVAVSLMLGLPYFAKEWRYGDLYETQENSERHKDTESRTCPPPPRGEVTGCDINKRDRNMELKKMEHAEILNGLEPTTDTKSDIPDRARENQNAKHGNCGNSCSLSDLTDSRTNSREA